MNHKGRIFFARLWKKDTLLNWNISHYRTEMKITFFLTDTRKFARPMGLGKIFLDAIEIKACNCKVPSPVKL